MKHKPRCIVCGRALKSKESIARGMGPVCAGKISKTRARSRGIARSIKSHDSDNGSGGQAEPLPGNCEELSGGTDNESHSSIVQENSKREAYLEDTNA